MLRQHQRRLSLSTMGRGLVEVTALVVDELRASRIDQGLATLFIRHTSASLVIQENADPDVRGDLDRFFDRLVEDGDPLFVHRSEGPDDMPAHVRAALTATQVSIPVSGGELVLGTWQGIYLWNTARALTSGRSSCTSSVSDESVGPFGTAFAHACLSLAKGALGPPYYSPVRN